MTRTVLLPLALLVLVLTLHPYVGQNVGAYLDLPGGHCAGLELVGEPGLFLDQDCS